MPGQQGIAKHASPRLRVRTQEHCNLQAHRIMHCETDLLQEFWPPRKNFCSRHDCKLGSKSAERSGRLHVLQGNHAESCHLNNYLHVQAPPGDKAIMQRSYESDSRPKILWQAPERC